MTKSTDASKRLIAAVEEAAKATVQRALVLMQGYIGQEFGDRKAEAGSKNTTDKLRVISARLFRSFARNSPDNITSLLQRGNVIGVESGTKVPYARIQEEGGSIDQTIPITQNMRRFFWAMFYKTQQDRWKAYALTRKQEMHRRITIPARPHIKPALQKMQRQGAPKLQQIFRQELSKAMTR